MGLLLRLLLPGFEKGHVENIRVWTIAFAGIAGKYEGIWNL